MEVELQVFLISSLGGGEWSAPCPNRFNPDSHWMEGPPRTLLGQKASAPACNSHCILTDLTRI
jgi:hypothetical protein